MTAQQWIHRKVCLLLGLLAFLRGLWTMLEPDVRVGNEPIKLHTREVDGRLGGHKWSGAFAAYIGPLVPTTVAEDKRRVAWWRILYVVNRLRHDERVNQTVLTAFLAFKYREDLDFGDVADRYGVTRAQFGRLDRYATRVYLH